MGRGNLPAAKGFSRGFDRYEESFNENTDGADVIPPGLDEVLKEEGDAPLFLFVHHLFVHSPYIYGPPDCRRRFLDEDIRVPGLPVGLGDIEAEGPIGHDQAFWAGIDLSEPAHREHVLALYDGGVLFTDRIFQKLRDKLKASGRYDDALIVVFSDHGEEFYEHGGQGHGRLFAEHLLVPLLVKFPGGKHAGRIVDSSVRLVDIAPTVLEIAGVSGFQSEGLSFLPLLDGRGGYSPALVSYSAISPGSVRLEYEGFSYSNENGERLFSLKTDFAEQSDLSKSPPGLRGELKGKARAVNKVGEEYLEGMGSPPETAVSPGPELEKRLKALGYL